MWDTNHFPALIIIFMWGWRITLGSHCAFDKQPNSEVQKPTNVCVFRCRHSPPHPPTPIDSWTAEIFCVHKIRKFHVVWSRDRVTFCEIWHFFSRTPIRNFLWCCYRSLITSLALENVKKNAICFKLFWYKVFIHWKLKLLNFPINTTTWEISTIWLA